MKNFSIYSDIRRLNTCSVNSWSEFSLVWTMSCIQKSLLFPFRYFILERNSTSLIDTLLSSAGCSVYKYSCLYENMRIERKHTFKFLKGYREKFWQANVLRVELHLLTFSVEVHPYLKYEKKSKIMTPCFIHVLWYPSLYSESFRLETFQWSPRTVIICW